jgi:hypothetical protein
MLKVVSWKEIQPVHEKGNNSMGHGEIIQTRLDLKIPNLNHYPRKMRRHIRGS